MSMCMKRSMAPRDCAGPSSTSGPTSFNKVLAIVGTLLTSASLWPNALLAGENALEDGETDGAVAAPEVGIEASDTIAKICMEHRTARSNECVDVKVLLTCNAAVEGFEVAVKHDEGLVLESITVAGTVTAEHLPELTVFDVSAAGGTAGVVMDIEAPFLGNVIPAGESLPILTYRYCCPVISAGQEPGVFALRPVNGEIGSPPKENTVVVAGASIAAESCAGSITVQPLEPGKACFLVGGSNLGRDGRPEAIEGKPGEIVEVGLFYTSPEDGAPGDIQLDQIQGFSMAIAYDCGLRIEKTSFRIPAESLLASADFVELHSDNDPADGDGCELVFGVLLEASPPFDGVTLPPTSVPLKLATIGAQISRDAKCGDCFKISFTDGVNGAGKIPVRNLYAAENQSFSPCFVNAEACITGTGELGFKRGDCNGDKKINTTDAITLLLFLFPSWSIEYTPPCFKACDSNDDGKLLVTDAIFLLTYLFLHGETPPPPGPIVAGLDPTPDSLQCELPCR